MSNFKPTRWQPIANPTLSGWGNFVNPCYNPQERYGDCPATLLDVLNDERIPVYDRIWAFCRCSQCPDNTKRLFAVRCIRETPINETQFICDLITDDRSISAIEVSERFAHGEATKSDLSAAWAAAWAAAGTAAMAAASDAASDAAWAAAWAAAGAAAGAAAWAAARAAQLEIAKSFFK